MKAQLYGENDGGLSDHENGHKSIAEQGTNALYKSLPGTKLQLRWACCL
jgi:hypothetical protein